ncbi:hypothetical protein LX95_01296 [Mesonia algae]|uniref:Uncharacterized protein n=1 Tax=Mesonia algae TaxID=213248 RepID=A0A2W7I968_9FLAO|nr:hypothetical protein [Mesonia algae]PZW41615.1 hypothetical protein LX95_01296 [Mesonia algae]
MQKPEYKTQLVVVNAGSNEGQSKITIPAGQNVYVGATKAGGDTDKLVRLQLEENGTTIHDAMNVAWYNGNNGSFRQRAIDLGSYKGGSELTLRAITTASLTAKATIEVVFEISKEGQTC